MVSIILRKLLSNYREISIMKNIYPCKPQFYNIKVGCKGGLHYMDMFSWCLLQALQIYISHDARKSVFRVFRPGLYVAVQKFARGLKFQIRK